jgi:putative endonuclease
VSYWVYILSSKPHGTLYVGMTSNLVKRAFEHREGLVEGFTKRYGVKRLVWFEEHATALAAIAREKSIKRWARAMKIAVIEESNPDWHDLYESLVS